jgi:DNA-binding MarR family transcriptional regulator
MNKTKLDCAKALSEWFELTMQVSMRNSYLFFRDKNLSHSQVIVLYVLQKCGTATVSDVGRSLSVSNPAASQMLDHLVKQELVVRREKEEDRRVRHHHLTEKGEMILHQAALARQKWQSKLVESLTGGERNKVSEALHILNQKLTTIEKPDESSFTGCIRSKRND